MPQKIFNVTSHHLDNEYSYKYTAVHMKSVLCMKIIEVEINILLAKFSFGLAILDKMVNADQPIIHSECQNYKIWCSLDNEHNKLFSILKSKL